MQGILRLALSNSKEDQQKVYQLVQQMETKKEGYVEVMSYICRDDQPVDLRVLAAMMLKGMVQRRVSVLPVQFRNDLTGTLLKLIPKFPENISRVLSLVLNVLIQNQINIEAMECLLKSIETHNVVALQCLTHIFEDLQTQNYDEKQMIVFLEKCVSVVLGLCKTALKQKAMKCFNLLIYPMPPKLVKKIGQYRQILLRQLNNPESAIAVKVMEGIQLIAQTRTDFISNNVIDLVANTNNSDSAYLKHECYFWQEIIGSSFKDRLLDLMDVLAPKWLGWLVYSPQDQAQQIDTKFSIGFGDTEETDPALALRTLRLETSELFNIFLRQQWDKNPEDGWSAMFLWEKLGNTVKDTLLKSNDLGKIQTVLWFLTLLEGETTTASLLEPDFQSIFKMLKRFSQIKFPRLTATSVIIAKMVLSLCKKLDRNVVNEYLLWLAKQLKSDSFIVRKQACWALGCFIGEFDSHPEFQWLKEYDNDIAHLIKQLLTWYSGSSLAALVETIHIFYDKTLKVILDDLARDVLIELYEKWRKFMLNDRQQVHIQKCISFAISVYPKAAQPISLLLLQQCEATMGSSCQQIVISSMQIIRQLLQTRSEIIVQKISGNDSNFPQALLTSITKQPKEPILTETLRLLAKIINCRGITEPQKVFQLILGLKLHQSQTLGAQLLCIQELMVKYGFNNTIVEESCKKAIEKLLQISQKQEESKLSDFDRVIGRYCLYKPEAMVSKIRDYLQKRNLFAFDESDSFSQEMWKGFFSLVLKYPELKDLISTFDGFEGQTNLDPEVSRLYNELQKIKPQEIQEQYEDVNFEQQADDLH